MSETATIASPIQRLAAEKSESARKKLITEISEAAKKVFTDYPPDEADAQTTKVLQAVDSTLLKSAQPATRRMGVAVVAAISCAVPRAAVGENRLGLIDSLCKGILRHFRDPDAGVRAQAVEGVMNAVNHLGVHAMKVCFGELYLHMLVVASDKEARVQQACTELSNVVRAIGDEKPECFDMQQFVHFLRVGLDKYQTSSEAVVFVLDWILASQAVPNRPLVLHLKEVLPLLVPLASSPQRTVQAKAEEALDGFAKALRSHAAELDLIELATKVLATCDDARTRTRQVSLQWLELLLDMGYQRLLPIADQLLRALLPRVSDTDGKVAESARRALAVLADQLVPIGAARNNSDIGNSPAADAVTSAAKATQLEDGNQEVPLDHPSASPPRLGEVPGGHGSLTVGDVNFGAMIKVIVGALMLAKASRLELLRWAVLVHRLRPEIVREQFDYLFPQLMTMLSDADGEVLHRTIEVLSIIAGADKFRAFIATLIDTLDAQRELLPKVSIIFKLLQSIYMGERAGEGAGVIVSANSPEAKSPVPCEKLFLQTAALLCEHPNKRFVSTLVLKLSSMLLTADEFLPLRELLKAGVENERAKATFFGLYDCWCYSPVSAIALSMLTRAYGLTNLLVERLGTQEPSVHTLVQLDRLVLLIESPVFSFVRMALLMPKENAPLVKALFGMMMILPQSSAQFSLLRQRLKAVTAVSYIAQSDLQSEWEQRRATEWKTLADRYEHVQDQVASYEVGVRSLHNAPS